MNDILRPELIWVEGRCYRINDTVTDVSTFQEHDLYENEIPFNEDDEDDDESDMDTVEITKVDESRYCTNLHVSKHYLGSIIGKKGSMINRIGRDTKTDIKTPRHGENKDITIYGSTISSVKAAIRRINIIVMSARMKQTATHFVSIPMNTHNIIKQFNQFKNSIISECSGAGLEESLFIKAEKLHITVGVMCLMDNEERLQATKLLTEARDKFIIPILQDHMPLKIRLKGLSYMNDDPRDIHVLYGCVEEVDAPEGILQELVDKIVQHFYRAGFMDKQFDRDNVKIHVTLLNTKYRVKRTGEDTRQRYQKRVPFDGSEILSKFSDYDFGIVEIQNIHLSQRNAYGPDGFYQPTCVISCNKQ